MMVTTGGLGEVGYCFLAGAAAAAFLAVFALSCEAAAPAVGFLAFASRACCLVACLP